MHIIEDILSTMYSPEYIYIFEENNRVNTFMDISLFLMIQKQMTHKHIIKIVINTSKGNYKIFGDNTRRYDQGYSKEIIIRKS